MDHRRRRVVAGTAGAAAAATFGWPLSGARAERNEQAGADPDVHIELRAVQERVALRPGAPTRVWRYRGSVLRGDAGTLEASSDTYLGPILRVRRGQRVRLDLVNELPEPTIVHWHGLHVPDTMDGHPRHAIAPGQRYVYEFTVRNRAGSYWFHPHPHGRTGAQVYFGLAGLFLVSDDEEAALGLPDGRYDLPLVLQDRSFDADNQFVYLESDLPGGVPADNLGRPPIGGPGMMGPGMMGGGMMGGGMGRGGMGGGMGSMMARMMGVLGDEILVNGRSSAILSVERRPYRLRVLNGSNTRIYKLAWHDGSPLVVIGSDGGLLAAPVRRDYVMLGPAERVDLWVDFARWSAGSELALQSLAFDGAMNMGGMMMGRSALPDGAAFRVLALRVGDGPQGSQETAPPRRLSDLPPADPRAAINFDHPKVFELTMQRMAWGINGRTFEMLGVTPYETVRLGTHELWEFRNDATTGMMGMAMPHAMHVHGVQFRVVGRSVSGGFPDYRDSVAAGFVDEGWKDTVLVMPGERVRILVHFADYPGLFLYHCHMLEHEDGGMMRNYRVMA
ncbi:MAG: multicopper oxidase domain-containing protein [Burkholderiaceae bacterium]|nr:multicopper oxidase domain-containing protein [Burkholderiaceae bacterium]